MRWQLDDENQGGESNLVLTESFFKLTRKLGIFWNYYCNIIYYESNHSLLSIEYNGYEYSHKNGIKRKKLTTIELGQ